MSKRPSFQFYPADWKANANLRRCSPAARGVWMDVLGVLHDSDEYGLVRWPLRELARAASTPVLLVKELVKKCVLKGSETELQEPFVYTPRSGRREGAAVILVPAQRGPIWFSSRMVKDEYIRTARSLNGTFGATPHSSPMPPKGDGSSTSSSSSSSSAEESNNLLNGIAKENFLSFWADYPKHVDRRSAELAFAQALLRADVSTILQATKRYAVVCRGEDAKFTKKPHNWLNSDSWLDFSDGPRLLSPEKDAETRDRADRIFRRGKYAEHLK